MCLITEQETRKLQKQHVKLSTLLHVWLAFLAWAPSCDIGEDAARHEAGGSGRDSSRRDLHSSHRSEKAMFQPRVHLRRREAFTFESRRPVSEAPLSLWRSCDLFSASGVAPAYITATAQCQNTALFVSVDSANGFIQRAPLWSKTGSDVRWQAWQRRGRPGWAQWGGPSSAGRVLLQRDTHCSLPTLGRASLQMNVKEKGSSNVLLSSTSSKLRLGLSEKNHLNWICLALEPRVTVPKLSSHMSTYQSNW